MLKVQFKITGEKPNVDDILSKTTVLDYSYNIVNDIMYLDVIVKDKTSVGEILRRLKAKKHRTTTKVEVTHFEKPLSQTTSLVQEVVRNKCIGWKARVLRRKTSHFVCINSTVVYAMGIKPQQLLYCYLEEDQEGRPIMRVYLDGESRDKKRELTTTQYNTFIEHQSELLKKAKRRKRWNYQNTIITNPKKDTLELPSVL